jgi:ribosome biogenesis protein Nip4
LQARKTRGISFTHPTEEEEHRILQSLDQYLPEQAKTQLLEGRHLTVGRGRRNEVFLVSSAVWKFYQHIQPHRNPYFLGLFLGELSPTLFRPSLQVLPILAKYGKDSVKVVVTGAGEQRFLYGHSLTKENLSRDLSNLQKAQGVLVVNEQGEGLGYGRVKHVSAHSVTITNQQDLGWYLRRGR